MHMPATELKEIYIDPRTDLREYEASVKAYRDIVNAVNTARMEGLEKGLEKGLEEGIAKGERKKQTEIARTLKEMGLDIPAIQKATGLTINEIREL